MRHFLVIAALVSTGLMPGRESAPEPPPTVDPAAVNRTAVDRAAVEAAMQAAVRNGFRRHDAGTQEIRVRLAPVAIADAGPAQRQLRAHGRVLLDGAGDWIPFEAAALYDVESATATATSLELAVAPADAAGAGMAGRLKAEATRRLRAEFAGQPAQFEFARVQARPAGGYLALIADGRADFGTEGTAEATIRALYDPRNGQWLRLDYDLGNDGQGG